MVFAVVVGLALCQWGVTIYPAYAPTASINIQNFAFNPQNATVQTSDPVTWTNNDPVIYTLWFTNATDGSTYLLSPPMNPGTTWTHTFPNKIRVTYYDFDRLYITGQLIIVPVLTADFGPTFSTSTTVTFVPTTSGGTSPYTSLWTFGDGTTSTATSPTHTYQSPGFYIVTLTITDSSTPNKFSNTAVRGFMIPGGTPGGGGGGRLLQV